MRHLPVVRDPIGIEIGEPVCRGVAEIRGHAALQCGPKPIRECRPRLAIVVANFVHQNVRHKTRVRRQRLRRVRFVQLNAFAAILQGAHPRAEHLDLEGHAVYRPKETPLSLAPKSTLSMNNVRLPDTSAAVSQTSSPCAESKVNPFVPLAGAFN